jgi:hypothetical protein
MDPVWKAKMDRGMFQFEDLDRVCVFLGRFEQGQDLEVIIRKPLKLTSTPQMRYYYGVVIKLISDYTGHTADEVDSILKGKFLVRVDSRGLKYTPSKTAITTSEMEEYLRQVRAWAAGCLSLDIPEPNEVTYAEDQDGIAA